MKKLLVCVLALCSLFAFASCANGKCDDCGVKNDMVVDYNGSDEVNGLDLGGEYCPTCAAKKALEKMAK